MSINYLWKIEQLERQAHDGLVIKVHWRVIATLDNYTVTNYGTVDLDRSDAFIPYEELTQQTVLEWVWSSIDKDNMETSLLNQIEQQKHPVIKQGIPWN